MSISAAASASAFESRDLLPVFNALPGAFLLLSPALRIEAVSDDYLAVAVATREQLVGQVIFDAFPDNPATPEAHSTRNLRASLDQVLATGQAHQMAQQHYDVPDSARPGHFLERYWLPTNRPVLDAQGRVTHIIHAAVDVTAQRAADHVLHASQAAEKEARAEAEAQRQRFYEVLMALPALVATYHGPHHVYHFVNAAYRRYFPTQALPGRSLREVLPEAEGQGVLALMDHVYQTGKSSYQQELEVWLDFEGSGQPRQLFLNLLFHPLRDAQGRVDGLLDFSYDVTEQVQARRQVERLNQELEARVQARTHELRHHQGLLTQIMRQVPAAIATFGGPEHRYTFFNDAYQALSGGRTRLGLPMAEVFPEMVGQGFIGLLDQVYATGQLISGTDTRVELRDASTGQPLPRYVDFIYQPLADEQGQFHDILVFIVNVTDRVRTRQRAEALQAEVLAAAQQQGHEREAFHAVFEQTPALIALLRQPGHQYAYVNSAYQALFAGRQLLGLDVAVAVPEMAQQGFVALLDHVYQSGETYFGRELPFAVAQPGDPAPRLTYFNFTMQAYREAGAIAGISIFAFDATEQVLARQERDARQQELQRIFEQAPVAVFVLHGPELVVAIVNPVMQELLGPPLAALLGRPYFEAMPELAAQGYADFLDQVWRTGQPFAAQEQPARLARHRPGETGYFTFVYQPLHDAQGRVTDIMCVATDVTDQVLARRAVEANAYQLRLLTDALPVLIGYLDRERRYRFANEAYRAWFHQDPAALLGRPVQEIVGEQAYAATAGYMDRALAGERLDFEATMPYREGFTRHIRTSFIPDVEHGEVQGFYTLVTDITEQVEARQQVEHLNQELRTSNQDLNDSNRQLTRTNVDLDNFIYTASHDLKAPISNIEGLLLALEHELPAVARVGDVPLMLTLMQEATERFQRTIGHLTDVSRLQQEHNQTSEAVRLAPVIEAVRLDLAQLVQQTQAQLDVQVPADLTLTFSEKNLRSVVYNLLSNALKYRHPDRTPAVRIHCRPEGGYQVLDVQDNGLGLDLVQGQDKLFAMFQRLHTHVEGTGIGLYMVKKIVENAGGRIEVDSQLGQGSTFRVFFVA